MRLLRRARLALAAFALFAGLSAARAQLCPTLPAGASVDPVLVSIAATDERRPHRAMIRGALRMPAALADERLRGITRANLCLAAVGDMLIDDAALCPSFGDAYSSLDRIERAGDRVDFALFTDVPRRAGSGLLDIRVFESPDRCAPRATFVVAAARNQEITTVPLLVDRLSEGRIGWTERQWTPGFSRDLAIGLRERRPDLAGQGGSAAAEPNLNPPRSWTSYARGEMFERLQEFLWVPVWVAVILAGFMAFGGALLYAEAQPPLAALVRALTAAVALYAAARWSGVALDIAQLLYNARAADGGGWAARALNNVPAGVDYGSGRTIAAAALMIPLTLLLWLGSLFLGAPRSGAGLFRHTARLVLRSLAVGSLIGLAFLLVATLAGIALPPDTPFEPPALAVSLFLAIWAVIAFSPLTGFGWGRAALAAAVATLLLLYPHPVIHGAGEPPSAIANALIWFPYVGSYFVPNAMLLTVALVAALKIARSDDQGGQTLASDRTLLFLFGFSVTLSSIGSLTSAALLFGVLAAADRLLFPRDSTAAGGAAADAPSGPRPRPVRPARLALGVAVVAAAVFWLQYSGDLFERRPGPPSLLIPAMLIYSAAVPAAIGGLLLQHSFERLPGPIAAAKALVITAFAFAASVATRLPFILAERSILPAIIDVLGIFTALIATAMLLYDGPQAREKLEGRTLKERLAGSGFGWFLTILSSAALAAASALTPVLFAELGVVFKSVVRETLGTNEAAGARTEPAAAPRQ